MKAEKQVIIDGILARINSSPFVLVADYSGMKVPEFDELRNRLRETGSEFHVNKNTFVKRAADAANLPAEIKEALEGQTAIITGDSDVCAAAKVLKKFNEETTKAAVRMGVLDGKTLDANQVATLAALPSREVLLAQLLGVFLAPATKLVRTLNEPAASLARVLQAKADQG